MLKDNNAFFYYFLDMDRAAGLGFVTMLGVTSDNACSLGAESKDS